MLLNSAFEPLNHLPFTMLFFNSVIEKQKGRLQEAVQMTRMWQAIFDGIRHIAFENIHYAGKRFDIILNDRNESQIVGLMAEHQKETLKEFT